ncbi:MAG: acyltransferase [Acidimicrobiia bacterium]
MAITSDVKFGVGVRIPQPDLVNLFGCSIGDESMIGPFVEIQAGAVIGRRCRIQSHSFICEGVVIEDEVFVGHGVMFINDRLPRATNADGTPKGKGDWIMEGTTVERGVSIGSNATILAGLVVGEESIVGAGAVVTTDVPAFSVVVGNPARIVRDTRERGPN